ncbi:glycosyltransferase family 4 protein [Thiohalocapsa marina]|uniref:Glycosyltransferase family 4 protein n=1 Tax=Thiohalocapsa marina TaxID=424902 RepID=A0A5M8FGV3_9GAMM|nr:glycosyltransferase family 4 protein [Thiohalocapsa marina]KAA6183947.1 glycosyltransferase family 4 protein [Thiohalocapsa marina]
MTAGVGCLRVLAVYIEPAAYILDLIRVLREQYPDIELRVYFIAKGVSQPWMFSPDEASCTLLPARRSAAIGRLRRELVMGGYDLVHLAGWGHPLLLATMLLSRLQGTVVAVESDTQMMVDSLSWLTRLKRLGHPLLFRLPTVFLPGGQRQAKYLRHYGVPLERIQIAQMTVDVTAISRHVTGISAAGRARIRTRLGLSGSAKVFLFVGRLEPEKGIDLLLAAFGQVKAQHDDVALLIIGDGALRELVSGAAATDQAIQAPGRLQGESLLDAYAVADAFVLPSRFEPWGLVVNEAMAAGLPVIVTDRAGCGEDLVEAGRTGLVVPAEDASALASALSRLARDHALRETMSRQALEKIAGWTLEEEAARVIAAWREALSP